MKKFITCAIILTSFLLIGSRATAQDYTAAAGLKFGGFESGISGKYFMTNTVAIEGVLGVRSHGVVLSGLYEINQIAFGVNELKFYYGAGAHLGAQGSGVYRRYGGDDDIYHSSHLLLGADGVVGLEYVIPKSPIAISLDLDPRAEFAIGPYFDLGVGLGLKYTFK